MQDENEEMGRELSEGKVHALERQVALAKGFVDDMRKGYVELEDHCAALDEEAEDLQRQACSFSLTFFIQTKLLCLGMRVACLKWVDDP